MQTTVPTLPLPRRHGDFLLIHCGALLSESILAQLHAQMQGEKAYVCLALSIDELSTLISNLSAQIAHIENLDDKQQSTEIITILNAYTKQLRLIQTC